jgi:hypothetical protein
MGDRLFGCSRDLSHAMIRLVNDDPNYGQYDEAHDLVNTGN